jgi:hypothetical protein
LVRLFIHGPRGTPHEHADQEPHLVHEVLPEADVPVAPSVPAAGARQACPEAPSAHAQGRVVGRCEFSGNDAWERHQYLG